MRINSSCRNELTAPTVFAPKKDSSLSFCIHYRKFNNVTVQESYPVRIMCECIDLIGNGAVFSTLDANHDNWQMQRSETQIATKQLSLCIQGSSDSQKNSIWNAQGSWHISTNHGCNSIADKIAFCPTLPSRLYIIFKNADELS